MEVNELCGEGRCCCFRIGGGGSLFEQLVRLASVLGCSGNYVLGSVCSWPCLLPEKIYKNLDVVTRILIFTAPFPMVAYPICLWSRSPGKTGSHFHPDSDLFVPSERKDVITSSVCWTAMAALLVSLGSVMGPIQLLKLYGIPILDLRHVVGFGNLLASPWT